MVVGLDVMYGIQNQSMHMVTANRIIRDIILNTDITPGQRREHLHTGMDIRLTGIRSGQATIPKNQIVVPTFIPEGAELPALIRMAIGEQLLTGPITRILIRELR